MSSAQPKSHEPSMEEILASIRRIISDDQPPKAEPAAAPEPPPAATAPAEPPPLEDDILDLGEDSPPEPEPETDEVMFADPPPPPKPPAPEPAWRPEPPRSPVRELAPPREDSLLSRSTDEAVGAAFQTLAGTILAGSQRTLDDIVKEMLRPMLKEWLDDNLPGIVERLVRAEIERVARGGR